MLTELVTRLYILRHALWGSKNIVLAIKIKKSILSKVSSFAYKYVVDLISPILSNIFNESVHLGCFPFCPRMARVIPIYKSSDKSVMKNYPSISTLPFLGKVFQRLIHAMLYSLFSINLMWSMQTITAFSKINLLLIQSSGSLMNVTHILKTKTI